MLDKDFQTKKFLVIICTLLLILFYISPVSAVYMADITYDYEKGHDIGNYIFTFTVNNTSDSDSKGPLDFFMINFDADDEFSLYKNLDWIQTNNWIAGLEYFPEFEEAPAVCLADDSILFGSGAGIAQGGSLGGFSVGFDYSGMLTPDKQIFSWYANFGTSDTNNGGRDMGGYWILGEASGITKYVPPPTPIPEPATILLFGSLLACLIGLLNYRTLWETLR